MKFLLIAVACCLSAYINDGEATQYVGHFYDTALCNAEDFAASNSNESSIDSINNRVSATTPPPSNPLSPLVACSRLPPHSFCCEQPTDLNLVNNNNINNNNNNNNNNANKTQQFDGVPSVTQQHQQQHQPQVGCRRWNGTKYEEVEKTSLVCRALPDIECFGNRTFLLPNYPCVKYGGVTFASTLLFSLMLGIFGVDRYCLGHVAYGIGKTCTLGGLGVWWLVDLGLLAFGQISPSNNSTWMPFY